MTPTVPQSARAPGRRRTRARRGMTLVELMVAMVMLTGVLLGMGKFITNFAHTASDGALSSTAADLVQDRLEYVKTTAPYTNLSSYAGIESAIPGHPNFTRETDVVRTNTTASDYTTITVIVSHPSLRLQVMKTTMISSF
jgi:prepilin-type N-terminal cleavage/methylation domain-containing protein